MKQANPLGDQVLESQEILQDDQGELVMIKKMIKRKRSEIKK